ncbi:sensor domain-containing diguanylate cyclase [Pseudomonas alliivorans]|uniref:diguanylate cyclase n=1 Tax=Pseudomonas alliivorans TaxID=2810613 RepID=A0ABS4BZC8_9PSED|nr:sensor domain-containing diguanylate cyclase [Pseudomonas alliivorans]MBP0943749.1 diguanylate cyclase [Pseudomonas alliivorans]MEE4309867.1 sensor domain-containing diguanylate cyclase [Pseudomonas alliivorans]MEE4325965.1 sensor domain-containing diguanylate cyclase [Pseudomonas alliivorans]MEE4336719.1 sensor domain-containing diguanylate cyclase [Pseudomonas alliivorans]MEE4367495.1 sensor domain-containing diguanylate cyclase [Pseudomonas alliivorans]
MMLSASIQTASYRWSRSELMLIFGSSLSVLSILTIVASLLVRERTDTALSAARTASNMVQLIDADVMRNAELYDSSLQGMIKAWQRTDLKNLSPELRQLVLFDRSTAAPYKGDLVLLDNRGEIIADSLSVIPRDDNFSDRSYFKEHATDPSLELHVSSPYKTRWGYKDWCIGFSRRMSGPNGEFMGIASAAMRLVYFKQLFMSQRLGNDSSINLINTQGILIVRHPEKDGQDLIGKDYSRTANFQRMLREGEGSFSAWSTQLNAQRFYTFSRVGNLPLIVVIGQSEAEVYAVWRRNAWLVGSATSVLCLGILWLTGLLCRELRRRQRAEDQLACLAATDGLTGLDNRRQMDASMETEWSRAQRSGKPLSMLMIDVDHFKAFNERHGHQGGDQALRKVAQTIASNIRRPGDMAARYGGEEFVVVLPETDSKGALKIAENVRKAIETLPPFLGDEQPITVSIGVASQMVHSGDKLAAFFGIADKALYQAKNNGRNRVELRVAAATIAGQA